MDEGYKQDSGSMRGMDGENGKTNEVTDLLKAAMTANIKEEVEMCSNVERKLTRTTNLGQKAKIARKKSAAANFSGYNVNKLGGLFMAGKPLPMEIREKIVEMHAKGNSVVGIGKELKVSQGCVSRLIRRFSDTGTVQPKKSGGSTRGRGKVFKAVVKIREKNSRIKKHEIQNQLVTQKVCSKHNVPSISTINRILRNSGNTRAIDLSSKFSEPTNCHLSVPTEIDFNLEPNQTPADNGITGNPQEYENRRCHCCFQNEQLNRSFFENYGRIMFYNFSYYQPWASLQNVLTDPIRTENNDSTTERVDPSMHEAQCGQLSPEVFTYPAEYCGDDVIQNMQGYM